MLAKFSVDKIVESINHFINRTGVTPIFMGANWDFNWVYLQDIISRVPNAVNLVGKTSLDQAFGVMRGSEIIVGYHCGLTNLGIMFKKKTVLIWVGASFPLATPLAIAPPETRGSTYQPLLAETLTIDRFLKTMAELYERKND
jgi:ADP-heptose:LPS heptosyltransferase